MLHTTVLILLISLCLAQDLVVYDGTVGQLENGFQSWSWATVSFQDTDVVAPGDKFSVSMVCDNYAALYAHASAGFQPTSYQSLKFSINGGSTGGQQIDVQLISGQNTTGSAVSVSSIIGGNLPANKWVQVEIPMSSFGATQVINGVWWLGESASSCGTVYFDDIVFSAAAPTPPAPVLITVDISQNRIPLSDLIFGVNWANSSQIADNAYTVNRWGGEGITRYAYDVDASNHASDWFFENLPETDANPNNLPYNSTADNFISASFENNALPIITTSLIGYTPIDRQVRCGFSVKKYGTQQKTDPYQPDCGNGLLPDGKTPITGNDPADTSRVINETFVLAWLAHIDEVFGRGKVSYFELDNEPGLWHVIHRDVHPNPLTYDELWNRTLQYAGALKKAYPNSKTFGPIPWGWCEYMYSPADNCADGPDRKAHGDLPLLEWYIKQVGDYKKSTGIQLVDVIDIHVYPQEAGVGTAAEDPATAALRFRSTRIFWDPTYVDESWINAPIYILPQIQSWIDQYCPGLQLAVSEYNWGDDNIITGALAQVMILGIFAQNNVLLATRWVAPVAGTRTEEAYKIFTNYDGKFSKVSGDSVNTTSNSTTEAESYAFYSSNTLYVITINKMNAPLPVIIDVSSAAVKSGTALLYGFSGASPLASMGSVTISLNGQVDFSAPAWSAVLAVIPV